MDALRSTLDTIDVRLGDLDSAVNIYSTQVLELDDMHNFLRDYTANVDNQVEFLLALANELFAHYDALGKESTDCAATIAALNEQIAQQQSVISQHDADIADIQNRINGQLRKINTIGTTVVDSNEVLDAVGENMTQLRNEYNIKKRKRSEDLDDIRTQIRRREALNARMNAIANDRREISDVLNAIETFPDVAAPPPATGGPGSRMMQGISSENIQPAPRRPGAKRR